MRQWSTGGAARRDQRPALDFSRKTFLVIDDFEGMRGMLRDLLRGCGVDAKAIDTVSSGGQAVAMLEKRKYDIVLCDYNLGAGKNGQQVLEEAKLRRLIGPACAWLMITAEKTSDAVFGAAECQPDGYLIKPITEATLRTRLAKIWAKKEAFRDIDKAVAAADYAKAVRLCDARLEVDKTYAIDLLRLKCRLLVQSGNSDKAKEVFEALLAEREWPWAKTGLARICHQSGKHERARQLLQEVVEANRTYLEAYDLLAQTLQALNEPEQAEQILDRAAKLSPNSVARQKSLGDLALKRGNLEAAEHAFRKSVALGEFSVLKSPDAYLGLARTYSAKGNPADALSTLGNLRQAFDSEEVTLRAKATEGMVHQQNGDPAKARQAARELGSMLENSGIRPDSATALEMAGLMLAAGDKDRAVALLQAEVKNNPDDQMLLDQVRSVFEQARMADEGNALVETSRHEAIELMNHGVLLAREGRVKDAVAWMRDARQAMPSNVRVLLNFAHVAILYMQKSGADASLADEARACLVEVNRRAPGEQRFAQLMEELAELTAMRQG